MKFIPYRVFGAKLFLRLSEPISRLFSIALGASLFVLCGHRVTAQTPGGTWETVSVPEPGIFRNAIVDVATRGDQVFLLMRSTDLDGTAAPATFHLLEWTGSSWADHGQPGRGDLDNPPSFETLAVGPAGEVWLGGDVEWHPILPTRPALVRWSPTAGWSVPEMIDLANATVYPNNERGGDVRALSVAPDGTAFAVGFASSFGNALDGSVPLFLVRRNGAWVEIADPNFNWPGSRGAGTFFTDVAAFSSSEVWAVGRHSNGGGVTTGGLVVHFDGTALTLLEDPTQGGIFLGRDLGGMAALAPDDIWAVGDGTELGGPTTTLAHYDGTGWTLAASPFASSVDLEHVAFASDGTGWSTPIFAGEQAAFFDGNSWTSQAFTTTPDVRIFGIAGTKSGALWAVGDRQSILPHAMRLLPPSDTDADNMADAWERQILDAAPNDTLDQLADVLPTDDFDGDGLDNFTEYAFALDPTSGADRSLQRLARTQESGNSFIEITFRLRSDDPNLSYRIETSDDLSNDQWNQGALTYTDGTWLSAHANAGIASQTDVSDGIQSLTIRLQANTLKRFVRLKAVVP